MKWTAGQQTQAVASSVSSSLANRPPEFIAGGDMSAFSLNENTPVGSIVYTLKARDPDGTRVYFYMSGGWFDVDRDSGAVRLSKPLDRETESTLDVIITVTDERIKGKGASNTVSLQREVRVTDFNDNAPRFSETTYSFSVSESTPPYTTVFDAIYISDPDSGSNSHVTLECAHSLTPSACDMFHIQSNQIGEGRYKGLISLKAITLNFESHSTYNLSLMARDRGGLSSRVSISINVLDVQDEPPRFLNAPYSVSLNESSPGNTAVLTILARDGDATPSLRRQLSLQLINDTKKYFDLIHTADDTWTLRTRNNLIDREDPEILLNGGLYQLGVKAVELTSSGRETLEAAYEDLTVVINDINDQQPTFSSPSIEFTIPEDMANGSAVAGLNLIVSDTDTGDNSKFTLSIEENSIASSVFSVSPSIVVGRSPVILKIRDSSFLDFEDMSKREYSFKIVASQGSLKSYCQVTVHVSDSNDHAPRFDSSSYQVQVPENAPSNIAIFSLTAVDSDSDSFGALTYSLRGLGAEKFLVNTSTGEISIAPCNGNDDQVISCLDYESQPSYSLTYTASDGGARHSSVSLFIEVMDVNDNPPVFTRSNRVREIYEGEQIISPPLFVRATDRDSHTEMRYHLKETNLTGLQVDAITGEVTMKSPVTADFSLLKTGERLKLNYSAIIVASDQGDPPLQASTVLTFIVKSERDGAPFFLAEPYTVSIAEDAPPGTPVIKVHAKDPDHSEDVLRYAITSGGKDKFLIDPVSGQISVSAHADLDRDSFGNRYVLTVSVTDTATPVPLTTLTTVDISISDVNDKSPSFAQKAYVVYMSDKEWREGKQLIKLTASDADDNAHLLYSIDVDTVEARDRTGFVLEGMGKQIASSVAIDETTGIVSIVKNDAGNLLKAAVVTLPIRVTDVNANERTAPQLDTCDLSIFIQSENDKNPIFAAPWTSSNPTYEISLAEETVIGSTVLTLTAKDSVTAMSANFEKIRDSDPQDIFTVHPVTGLVTLNKRLDYEELSEKTIRFSVKAIGNNLLAGRNTRPSSVANIIVKVQDMNDFSPTFDQDRYEASILESSQWPSTLVTVHASDPDSGSFGTVRYSLSGDGSNLFTIDPISGLISVARNVTLDREVKASYSLQVTATDNLVNEKGEPVLGHESSAPQRGTSVLVLIKLLDVNDNKPKFDKASYEAVVAENASPGFVVTTVTATDADEGLNGQVNYEILGFDQTPAHLRMFSIDTITGEITVLSSLAGKGRREAYSLDVRASDMGSPQLVTDTTVSIVIGDIAANDGIPVIIRPAIGEIIYVTENCKPGTFVYDVDAVDPDNPNHPNGRVMYKLLDPSPYFDLDPVTGIITTASIHSGLQRLPPVIDREMTGNFTLILVAHDLGSPVQETQHILSIVVNDTDDNEPYFQRSRDAAPLVFEIEEEQAIGSVLARIRPLDADEGVNAQIVCAIIDGDTGGYFTVDSSPADNSCLIRANKRLDRETDERFILTVKAFNPRSAPTAITRRQYDRDDLSQIQLELLLRDVDDNPPQFTMNSNCVAAVKFTSDVNTHLLTVKALDPDSSQNHLPIAYELEQVHFVHGKQILNHNASNFLQLDSTSGSLSSALSLRSLVGGYLNVTVRANNAPLKRPSRVNCKVFILRNKDLLKFTFKRRPDEMNKLMPSLQESLSKAITGVTLNLDTVQFLERSDGSLDFESTSACFQLIKTSRGGKSNLLDHKEAMRLLHSKSLSSLLSSFHVNSIEECVPHSVSYSMSSGEMGLILVAIFIAITGLILASMASSMKSRYNKRLMALHQQRIVDWQQELPLDTASFRSFPTIK